jgi:dephospho-CoA kinase
MENKIAFIGKMMSGKTTASKFLVESREFGRLAFAYPVKEFSVRTLNSLAHMFGREQNWTMETLEQRKSEPQVRKLLQLVGTELGRELVGYENVWVDLLIDKVEYMDRVVVDDCRFPNEAEALKEAGFTIVRVIRPEQDRLEAVRQAYPDSWEDIIRHPSETSLDHFEADITITASTVHSLKNAVHGMFVD